MDALVLSSLIAAIIVLSIYCDRYKRHRFPPGPKGLPVLGNILDVPRDGRGWLTYQRWGREYGSDVIHLRVLGSSIVVLNSATAAFELFDKRSSIYSDRQHSVILHDFIGWGKAFAFLGYNDDWREHRRLFHQQFHGQAIQKYQHKMVKEARKLIVGLLTTDDFTKNLRLLSAATILSVTYGMEIEDNNDSYILLAEKAMRSITRAGTLGSYMVEFVPLMRYIPSWAPGGQFKVEAAEWSEVVSAMFTKPLELVKKAMTQGTASPSIAAALLGKLEDDKQSSKSERLIRNVAGVAYVGGADTSASALGTFVLAMIMNPTVQAVAQGHIDRVIGKDSLPDYAHREFLPYITAIMYEVLRWRPTGPLAVPHRAVMKDEYKGYQIPAGAIVVGNSWAILHDPVRFPDPDTFDPTRWLTPDGQLSQATSDAMVAFGFGRRICPGRHFAMESIWISMVHILAMYNIAKPVDESGTVVEPSGEYTSGLVVHPLPFEAVFKPRSAAALSLIQSMALND
ncbi:uncharacterized protein PHACADRAFT_207382 [Phanerochaete carnosa HHB-10118-sp]|uniref:Cytochrome P450 n=1 Tax=Phanerochaete carnosa (strain HHB-10118-sp) TaxID=650164 RepID=K5W3V0_PHACS|nr:uncharacterized protein PHACADRAFT_207382 [Phanerochaete carnosa HHB-10118-sp]EKM58563.1 hypothetical protein PHACADRAFT_207382 [Phanerochaete carnosa HHB-10118-sp]